MFYLTSDITIGSHAKVKPSKVTWKMDINSFTDTCTIELPRISYLKTVKTATEDKQEPNERKEYVFKEYDKISVLLGYDGNNVKRFEGFLKRVTMGIPVKIECEGYSYLLYDIIFSKTYSNVTVKQLLTDLCAGTEIVLSSEMPHIPLVDVRFKNATGFQVLEWLQKSCHLAVYFNFNELYVGTQYGKKGKRVKLKLGWNTIKEDDFKQRIVDKNVRVVIREKNDKGEVKKTKSDVQKYSDEKEVKIKAGIPADLLKQIANRLQTKKNYNGYEGELLTFLEPATNKGDTVEVDGFKYPEKSGSFFVECIEGSFGPSGGRQKIQLGFLTGQ
jgi:hypothetical protein